jgi:hypothetical protein
MSAPLPSVGAPGRRGLIEAVNALPHRKLGKSAETLPHHCRGPQGCTRSAAEALTRRHGSAASWRRRGNESDRLMVASERWFRLLLRFIRPVFVRTWVKLRKPIGTVTRGPMRRLPARGSMVTAPRLPRNGLGERTTGSVLETRLGTSSRRFRQSRCLLSFSRQQRGWAPSQSCTRLSIRSSLSLCRTRIRDDLTICQRKR